ncbi:MAG: NAD(P)H-hydrate dehydratase [Candidatus Parvarchaeota archaeon]|nr:NAD(P)H-hydrate dehydratase [Candidatus Parvarchaeota archaeon]MCW1295668.1 NAD(P)H-hydrate dehydratase [Candidatus Parvarchaeum tengchongense]MCW1299036.1 NAD(P)H-hydrate dehydratase [Candidatus Parvarchaeum tengchongense]MCW1312303.1 NAD(P)H-hydrate dehydratase [Candidatus Parvarchaeum tengchongense]
MIYTTLNQKIIKTVYKKRDNWSHKGNFGKVLVVGGSEEYTGSPAIVALSALRAGADLTKIIAPRRAADTCAGFSPEIITEAINGVELNSSAFHIIKEESEKYNVMVLGNGIKTGYEQTILVNKILKEISMKIVLDADAIKVADANQLAKNIVITPNSNEFKILFKEDPSKDLEKRIKQVYEKAREFNTTIILKGHVDVISNGENTFINKNNSVYMTKGGTGDSLAGITAAMMCQNNNLVEAAAAAAFINGYTGRTVAKKERESFSVMHLIDSIGETINKWRYQ